MPAVAKTVEHLPKPLKLRHKFSLWEQLAQDRKSASTYGDSTREVAIFNTVEAFWRLWALLPQPSELVADKKMIRRDPHNDAYNVINALMIFETGIRPEWESAENARGGHFEVRLSSKLNKYACDEYWNNIVLGLIGNSIDYCEYITGIRLVDKLNHKHSCFRIEIWIREADTHIRQALKTSISICLTTKLSGNRGLCPAIEYRRHKEE